MLAAVVAVEPGEEDWTIAACRCSGCQMRGIEAIAMLGAVMIRATMIRRRRRAGPWVSLVAVRVFFLDRVELLLIVEIIGARRPIAGAVGGMIGMGEFVI